MNLLVSTDWLAAELGKSDLRVIDATMFLPQHGRQARTEFETAHIPGAVFFDIDEVSDTSSPLPHMLPSAEKFASRMQALGLGDGSRIVVYDNSPLRSAARVWWMLTLFGAHQVAILDGGFEKWQAEGRAVESGKPVCTGSMIGSPLARLAERLGRPKLRTDCSGACATLQN